MGKDCVPAVNIASWTIGPKIAAHVIVEAVWPTLRVSTTGNRWEKRKEHSASDRVSWSCAHGSNLLGRVTYIQLLLCFFFSHGQSMIFDEFLVSRLPGLTKWEMGLGRPRVQTPHAPPMSWILSYLVCHSMSSGFYLSFHIVSCPGLSWTLCIDSSSCVYFRRLYPANTMVTMVAVHSNCLSRSQQTSADLSSLPSGSFSNQQRGPPVRKKRNAKSGLRLRGHLCLSVPFCVCWWVFKDI